MQFCLSNFYLSTVLLKSSIGKIFNTGKKTNQKSRKRRRAYIEEDDDEEEDYGGDTDEYDPDDGKCAESMNIVIYLIRFKLYSKY